MSAEQERLRAAHLRACAGQDHNRVDALDRCARALALLDPELDNTGKVIEHLNPKNPAFAVVQYESLLVHGWNHARPHVKAMLRKGAIVVRTSRDYIHKRARNDLKESAFPLPKNAKSSPTRTT